MRVFLALLFMVLAPALAEAQEPGEHPAAPALKNQPVPSVGKEAGNGVGEQNSAPESESADKLLPVIQGIEAAIRDLIAEEDEIEREAERRRNDADLRAQEEMARWAFWMTLAAGASTLLTAVGVVLIWRTLLYTKQAAIHAGEAVVEAKNATKAAQDAIAVTDKASERQLRAYISVAPDGINPLKVRDKVIGHVRVRNVGQVIARDVRLTVKMTAANKKDVVAPVFSKLDAKQIGAIAPSAEIRRGSYETIGLDKVIPPAEKPYLFVWGAVFYTDGFDKERMTSFSHRYDADSGELAVNSFGDVLSVTVGPENARYTETGNDAD